MNKRGLSGAKLSYLRKREAVHAKLKRETSQKRFPLLQKPKPAVRGGGQ